ncbi:Tyrosine/nicotianamine aminotransferase [Caulochytrium protostelioides]|uniref:Tyrosine/nicotianamine aminotransferase n=1 Tax=Caulochytrium protostelioides TaxID=1555241 RepID=A0A4P9WYZ9_9FUNG|nr:Tyrosine/nicotianamine aminotransferase [Caulochytrium protostelioides]
MPREITTSAVVKLTRNPIRDIVDNLKIEPPKDRRFLSLALGDPTVFGNLQPNDEIVAAVETALRSHAGDGYSPSAGYPEARAAIADFARVPSRPLAGDDVIITSGASHALYLTFKALVNPGDNVLLPAPGFPLYDTQISSLGGQAKFYPLDPARNWAADVAAMDALVDDRTVAILVCNPSNPCGSVFDRATLEGIIAVAERHGLPIIADEIYLDLVFDDNVFHPIASLSTTVPMIGIGGLAKKFLVPGWRIGWVLIWDDPAHRLAELRRGLMGLSALILGGNSLIQRAIPTILKVNDTFHRRTLDVLINNAHRSIEAFKTVPGITCIRPQGAMYLMLQIDVAQFRDIRDDRDFAEQLVAEEGVLVLPGQCFHCTGHFARIVFTAPAERLDEAYARIDAFCRRHQR